MPTETTMRRLFPLPLALAMAGLLLLVEAIPARGVVAQQAPVATGIDAPLATEIDEPRTTMERTAYARHTSHAEMVEYLKAVQARSSDMSLGTFGRTHEGRELYYALFSRPAVHSPAAAHASGKPILVFGANAHGHNYILREALLILMRELGDRESTMSALLDDVIVLVVPSKNPDGLEAESRFNAFGADLNRDYLALEHPEMAAYVGNLLHRWHPHLFIDGHDGGAVQYGGAYPYNLLYQAAGTAGADPSITALADERLFPRIERSFEEAGFQAFYWARGDAERWYGGGSAPRMGRNYGGLANKLSIVFESAAWHERAEAIESGILAFRTVMEFARDEGDALIRTIREAERRTIELGERAEGRVPVEERLEAEDFRVTYRIAHPDGGDRLTTVREAEIVKKPVGTRFRERPYAYLLPPDAEVAARLLRRHRITVERLVEPADLDLRVYRLAEIGYEPADNNHAAAVLVSVGGVEEARISMPRGSFVVRTGQPLGRVVTQLMEPESRDNLVYWGRFSRLLPVAELNAHRAEPAAHEAPILPIYKLMTPGPLPTMLIP